MQLLPAVDVVMVPGVIELKELIIIIFVKENIGRLHKVKLHKVKEMIKKCYPYAIPIWFALSILKVRPMFESLQCIDYQDINGCVDLKISWFIVKPGEYSCTGKVNHFL